MLRNRRARWALMAGIIALALAGLSVGAFQPWTANHFGYALPGPRGLPSRIHHGSRDYHASGMCAGADWCQDDPSSTCLSSAQARQTGWWPLQQVGTLYTLAGPWYPITAIDGAPGTLLFVRLNDDCYIVYELEGGP